MKRLAFLLTVLALPFGAVACGGDDATEEGGAAAGETIQVSGSDFAFEPETITASDGNITFEFTNDGGAPHALSIEGNGVDESSETINAGESTTFEVSLEDGSYELYCPVADHKDRGMVGSLNVSVGGGGTTPGEGRTGETDTEDEDETHTETNESSTEDSSGSGSDDDTNY